MPPRANAAGPISPDEARLMTSAYRERVGGPGALIVVDHAAAHVPPGIDLGIDPALIQRHIGWDIGAAAVAELLADRLGCRALFGTVSRLVIDLHREEDHPALIPVASDGHAIPGNAALDAAGRAARIADYYRPYHARLAAMIDEARPDLIVAVHSFTPRLETAADAARPWQVGILYNQDDRAARIAIDALRAAGIVTGDNEPYSGRLLNATMNRHAEARGIPYLAIEVRQDLIDDAEGARDWAERLLPVIRQCRAIK
jgi:predicted N-formylglutamate amidohydrolase